MFREFDINIEYFSIGLLPTLRRLEWCMASAQLIAQNANTPNIDHLIVLVSHDNFRRDIVEGATESGPFISRIMEIITLCLYRLTTQSQPA